MIDTSELGFKTETGLTFPSQGWKIEKITRNKMDSVWKPLWGKRVVVPDKYNEIKLCLVNEAKPMDTVEIAARAYNEGMAFVMHCLKVQVLHWNLPLLILQVTILHGFIMGRDIILVQNG